MTDKPATPASAAPAPKPATLSPQAWKYVALSLIAIFAIFSGAVIGVLVTSYSQETATGYPQSNTLEDFRQLIHKDPSNEALRGAFRSEDVRIRHDFDVLSRRLELGSWLLFAGLIALLLAGRWYFALEAAGAKPTRPTGPLDQPAVVRTRSTIALVGIGLALVAGLVAMRYCLVPPPILQQPPAVAGTPGKTTEAPTEAVAYKDNWPGFRGPTGMGIVHAGDWPKKWDAKTGENIIWKTPIPLPGTSSPVVWGSRVFVTGADAKVQKVYCLDRATGKILWEKAVQSIETAARLKKGPSEQVSVSEDAGYAAPTPVTDGKRLYVLFATADLAALEFDGTVAWVRNFGKPANMYGLAASLAFVKDTVIFQFDQGESGDSKLSLIYGLGPASGSTVWSTPRPVGASWSSPIVADTDKGAVILTCGNPWVIAYDPETGSEIWRCDGLAGDVAVSPVYAYGMVYVTNERAKAMAIRAGGKGDVTATNVAWSSDEGLPDSASPVCDGKLFLEAAGGTGSVTCLDTALGGVLWAQDFPTMFRASPVLAGDVVYLAGEDGKVRLLKLAGKFELLAEDDAGAPVKATPAFCDGRIFIRTATDVLCIGSKTTEAGGKTP